MKVYNSLDREINNGGNEVVEGRGRKRESLTLLKLSWRPVILLRGTANGKCGEEIDKGSRCR